MNRDEIAAEMRAEKAKYPGGATEYVLAVGHIHGIANIAAPWLSDADRLAEIREVLAALDLVHQEAAR